MTMHTTSGIYLTFLYLLAHSYGIPEDTVENLLQGEFNSAEILDPASHDDNSVGIDKRSDPDDSDRALGIDIDDLDDIKRSFKYTGVGKRNFKYASVGKRNFKYAGVGKRNFKYSGVGKRNFRYASLGKRDYEEDDNIPDQDYLNEIIGNENDKRGSYQYVGVGKRDDEDPLEDKRASSAFRYSSLGKRAGFKYPGVGKRAGGAFRYSGVGKRGDSFRYTGVGKRGDNSFKYASFGKRDDYDENVDDEINEIIKRGSFKYSGVGKRASAFRYTGVGKRNINENSYMNENDITNHHIIHKRNVNDDLGVDKLAKRLGYAYMYPSVGKREHASIHYIPNDKRYRVRPPTFFRNQFRRRDSSSFRFQGIGKRDDVDVDRREKVWKYSGIGKRSNDLQGLLDYVRDNHAPQYDGLTNSVHQNYDNE